MDDNYGPDFDEDFLNQPLEYEEDLDDEMADLYFSTLNKQLNIQVEEDQEQENEARPSESTRKRPQYSADQPLGSHPLDWFVNTEFNSVSTKRKKMESIELKQQSMLDKIVAKKKTNESHFKLTNTISTVDSKGCLKIRPIDGIPFYEVANPDRSSFGYIEIYSSNQTLKPKRVLAPSNHLINSILNSTPSIVPIIPETIELKSSELWSQKYQPRSVLELLTENEHSKVVMAWLELWDESVFKRKKNCDFQLSDYYKSMMETEIVAPHLPKKKVVF